MGLDGRWSRVLARKCFLRLESSCKAKRENTCSYDATMIYINKKKLCYKNYMILNDTYDADEVV